MLNYLKKVELILLLLLIFLSVFLSYTTDSFLTLQNLFDILNNQAVSIIFAVGLVVVLMAGGIDISFSIVASVVQYIVVTIMILIGGGNWFLGICLAIIIGVSLGFFNALLICKFRIVSIVATIGTFNLFFGLLMYFTKGHSIYNIPDWLYEPIPIIDVASGNSNAILYLPIIVAVFLVLITWFFLTRIGFGRIIIGFGSDLEAARRSGVNVFLVQFFVYGWLGLCAGIGGLMQSHIVREVVPNALYGRELDILSAVVLGGAVLGGGRGTVWGAVLGVMLLAVVQNGLNLLGITPFAFKLIVGLIFLVAISAVNIHRFLPLKVVNTRED
ncbi:ABC transporter permease [Marinomonas flavescens]|uniref:ABC transporter permease n=1 Tax=Marinomonas flavescens TaxID=2529379 RepID=UPI00105619EC|nr:ABC transporter permease [Marinomonas flavescens]